MFFMQPTKAYYIKAFFSVATLDHYPIVGRWGMEEREGGRDKGHEEIALRCETCRNSSVSCLLLSEERSTYSIEISASLGALVLGVLPERGESETM